MIEVEEVKAANEMPTETDVRLLFDDLKKPMEALQKMFVFELEKLNAEKVNTEHASIEIKDGELIVRLGDYVMFYKVEQHILKLGVLDG